MGLSQPLSDDTNNYLVQNLILLSLICMDNIDNSSLCFFQNSTYILNPGGNLQEVQEPELGELEVG